MQHDALQQAKFSGGPGRTYAVALLAGWASQEAAQRIRTAKHFASLGRAFQADGRGFSPIEGGLEGGGSVS